MLQRSSRPGSSHRTSKRNGDSGKNRIMIYGPKNDGTYIVEFKTAADEALAISIPEAAVIQHFQERMPYGLFVPDVSDSR
jgi:hypothetical protein